MRFISQFANVAVLCALSLGWLLATGLSAQEEVRSDRRLPPGVLVYGSTPDIPASYEAFQNTSYGQLINGPELEAFRVQLLENFEQQAASGLEDVEAEFGMTLSDFTSLFAGDATFAIVRPIGQPLGGVLMLEIGDHVDLIEQLISKIETQLAEVFSQEKQVEDYDGTQLNIYSIETAHPDFAVIDVTYFLKDGHVVVASSRTLAESILERWDGQHSATFADDEIYATIREKCAPEEDASPDSVWFVNPIGLTTASLELVPQAKPFTALIPLYLPTLGLNRLKATGAVMDIDAPDFNMVTRSLMYVDRPAAGILKFFELRPTLSTPSAWVPASSSQYMALDWNIAGAYEAVEAVYDGFLGPGSFDRQMTDLTRQANQENLHPKRDVVDVIAGKIEGYLGEPGEDGVPAFALAIDVTDEEKAWNLVNASLESSVDVSEHDIRGTRAFSTIMTDDTEIAITVKDKQILVASGIDRLSQVLSGEPGGTSLQESAEFQRAQKHLPEQVSMLSYQSPVAQLRSPYEKLRAGEFDDQTGGQFDFSVLPPFQDIEKYFAPTVSYLIPDEKGALSVQMSLKPKE